MSTNEKKSKGQEPEVLEIHYGLAELPSSQHRAGLAGLVLMVEWMKQQSQGEGICEIERSTYGATLRINRLGLQGLFDELYSASNEEKEEQQLRKNIKTKEIIPPLRQETREVINPKTGKTTEKTIYFYQVTIPKGSFLLQFDPTSDSRNGLWIKLWRDCIWSIFRGVPATRGPFEDRANGVQSSDTLKVWQDLLKPHDHPVPLPSTYFVGAQANNAENVPFLDRVRFQFLLHFWPYVAQIYVPAYINNKDEVRFVGYAIAIPDIADLDRFCDEFPGIMKSRTSDPYWRGKYLPQDCIVDLVVEGALDTLGKFQKRLKSVAGGIELEELLLGIDVVHLEKQGNNIRLLNSIRIDPESEMVDQYANFRSLYWNQHFRRQRLLNLLNPANQWYTGFDNLFARLPFKQTIGDDNFRRDVRLTYQEEMKMMREIDNDSSEQLQIGDDVASSGPTDQQLVYQAVSNYLNQRLDSKYNLAWKSVKSDERRKSEYNDMKTKLAREAFLAIRSRTGQDFIEYFVSTLCSVSQSMNEQRYVALTSALMNETDNIRTLTMLALAAQTPWSQKKAVESES